MTLTTPALLFPALSLLLLAYTNRFLTIAGLIRALQKDEDSCENELIVPQIDNLKKRVILIRNMQLFGILSLFFCVLSMFMIFLNQELLGEIVFGMSLIIMLLSLFVSMQEILISTKALEIQLGRCGSKKNKNRS